MTTAALPANDAAATCQRLRDQLAYLKLGAVGEALPGEATVFEPFRAVGLAQIWVSAIVWRIRDEMQQSAI